MKTGIRIFVLFSALLSASAFGQAGKYFGLWWDAASSTEHFVVYNPFTSARKILDTIPGVKLISSGNSAYDSDSKRYVFVGGPTGSSMEYNVIDAITGAIVSQSPVSGKVDCIAYSPMDQKFYGIMWDAVGAKEFFVSIDPYTSATTVLDTVPSVKLISPFVYTFDTDSNRYVFVGGATSGTMAYNIIDASTGSVVSQTPVGDKIDNIRYSPHSKTFIGLWWDGIREHTTLIDPYTSTKTLLDTVSGVKIIASGYAAYDSDTDRYVFSGGANGNILNSYVMDASNGGILSVSPQGGKIDNIQYGGVFEASYDGWDTVSTGGGSMDTSMARHDTSSAKRDSSVARDSSQTDSTLAGNLNGLSPTALKILLGSRAFIFTSLQSDDISLFFNNDGREPFSFTMHDISGKTAVQMNNIRSNEVRIENKGLERGIYFFQIRNNRSQVGSGKLVIK